MPNRSWRRVTAKTICCQLKGPFSNLFPPIQHKVSTEGATELVVNHIRLLLEATEDWVLHKADVENAVNSVRRSHLLQQVQKSFPEIMCSKRILRLIRLFTPMGRRHLCLLQTKTEGIHQGDPLGPCLFSIAIQDILQC